MSKAVQIQSLEWQQKDASARVRFVQHEPILFDVDLQFQVLDESGESLFVAHIGQAGWDISWMPSGGYEVHVFPDWRPNHEGRYLLRLVVSSQQAMKTVHHDLAEIWIQAGPETTGVLEPTRWTLSSTDGADLSRFSWHEPRSDWFGQHFDHAARVIIELMMNKSDAMRGRILDVGCGDGVTDLGVFLRCQPELLVGVDPFGGYERLPKIAAEHDLPSDVLGDSNLRFEPHSANDLPFDDNSFDVVLSWGSLEHIAGGYRQALTEIRRVLKPGGLFFVHPGLYYSTLGNHLGEFFDDPFIHLRLSEEKLKQRVLSTEPRYMDRAGYFAKPEDYWRWYTELNPITVSGMEEELREMGFQPWRVALRTADVVEFSEELRKYSLEQLCIAEMYGSFVLEKDGDG